MALTTSAFSTFSTLHAGDVHEHPLAAGGRMQRNPTAEEGERERGREGEGEREGELVWIKGVSV